MKSKTYFFNKAIFIKNLTLYWPIPVCFLFYCLIKVPGRLWFSLQKYGDASGASFQALSDCLNLKIDIVAIAVCALLCGMSVFGYLFSTRSAYMIHALPVMRSELFFTNCLSALSFMFFPEILVFFVTVIFCLANGIAIVQYVGLWLLTVLGVSFFMFSVVAFCAMLTGLLFALPVIFALINYAALGCCVGTRLLLSQIGYGISYSNTPDIKLLKYLSPVDSLLGAVSFSAENGLSYSGGRVVAGYTAAAFFVYALSNLCYKKRRSECAGDIVAYEWLKPVFRWIVGLGAGYAAAILINSLTDGVPIWASLAVAGLIVYFVTDMFIQKSFRVFTGRRLRESMLFLGFTAASYGCVYGAAYGVESYVPDESKVENAYIYMNYPVEFSDEDIEEVLDIHEQILSHSRELQVLAESDETEEVLTVSLIYHLKNGRQMERLYQLPSGEDFCEEIAEKLCSYEAMPDSFMKYIIGLDYGEITRFEESQVEVDSDEDEYEGHSLSEEVTGKVYRAVCEDAKDGTLQKYNLRSFGDLEDSDMFLYIEFYHTSEDWEDVFDVANGSEATLDNSYTGAAGNAGSAYGYLNISFGEDCGHIMEVLREEGVLD